MRCWGIPNEDSPVQEGPQGHGLNKGFAQKVNKLHLRLGKGGSTEVEGLGDAGTRVKN